MGEPVLASCIGSERPGRCRGGVTHRQAMIEVARSERRCHGVRGKRKLQAGRSRRPEMSSGVIRTWSVRWPSAQA